MLAKMYLTNFLSFKERTEIDLTASKYSILGKTNVYKSEILKGALFIGPNASGKSNALKGLSFIIKIGVSVRIIISSIIEKRTIVQN